MGNFTGSQHTNKTTSLNGRSYVLGKRQITVVVFVQSNSDSSKETGKTTCFSFRANSARSHFVYKVAKNIQHYKILNKMVTIKEISRKCTIYIFANYLNLTTHSTHFIYSSMASDIW